MLKIIYMEVNKHYSSNIYVHFGIIIVVCFFSFFVNNQVIPADLMEARNLATAQEMVHYGNYLLPTMNGEPRLEKPPLPTWIAAGVEHIAPGNLVVQRYAAGLSATLMVLFLYLLVTRLTRNRKVGLIASLILATSVNVILMGRTVTWDIYTHSFMLGAIYFLVVALEEQGAQWKYFLLSGFFIGLSFLSKGPVSFYALLIPFLISYIIVYRTGISGKKWAIAGMVVVSLIVSFWWYGYTYFFHQDFAVEIAQKESSSWLDHNVRPWYYYWKFAAEAGIWALFWITAIIYFFINKQTIYQKEYKFSFIWFLASLVLLSVVPEKKSRYLLPLLIPGAMLIGFYIYQMIADMKTKSEKVVFRINAIVISLVLLALPVALYLIFYKENQVSLFILIVATICSWGLCVYILQSLFGRKGIRPANVFGGFILTMVMIAAIYLIPIGSMFLNEERHSIRLLRENKEVAGLPFYYNEKEELRMELVYETNRRIGKMNPEDDMAVEKALPFVFISGESIEKLMSDKNVTVEYIETFDNNWRKTDHKRHNPELVREVAIIRAK
jgi:4-amino-4-deoxy-L-arabinose transferase-like glycosyltransferase